MSAAKIGRMLKVNGSFRFIWNTSGRHDTCGHTSMPSARAATFSLHDPLVPRVVLDREERGPRERATDEPLDLEHVGVLDRLARQERGDAAPRVAQRLEQRVELAEVGEPRRHRSAAVAAVGRRRAGRESGRAGRDRVGDDRAHARELVVGRGALVARFAHDPEPHRGVADVAAVVERGAVALDRVEVLGKVSKSHGTPASSVARLMSSTCCNVRDSRSRCSGWHGAIEKPQLPAITDVTPWYDDGVSDGSQKTCAS